MKSVITTKAQDLDGFLTDADRHLLDELAALYGESQTVTHDIAHCSELFTEIGDRMKTATLHENIHVYGFETQSESHSEASRLIAKLRHPATDHYEFMYYTQRAYEMLFKLRYVVGNTHKKLHAIETPVTIPTQQVAVHKMVDIDDLVHNSVMCVLLRAALLPSMILSKEIEEYSSTGYVTPFALFRVKRNETKSEADMEYDLFLEESYFKLDELNDKDLIFADPMNATGGSIIATLDFLKQYGVKPRSVHFFNVIAAMKGALRCVRAIENCHVYTMWMDPWLNENGYICSGLGDAGDRLNGKDGAYKRGVTQLIADYGANVVGLYRSQVREIESVMARSRSFMMGRIA
jgi:uracil phosphoribosyltransferase